MTSRGDVRARWVVRATEGYTSGLVGQRRTLVPLNCAMVVTEPVDGIGWEGGETLLDAAHAYCYLQRTADGRVAIGGRGVPYRFGSRTDRAGEIADGPSPSCAPAGADVPGARDVRVDHAWAGVLGVARDWSPSVGATRGAGLAWAGGYVGDGVSTTNLAGRTLRDLILATPPSSRACPGSGTLAPLGARTACGWLAHPWRLRASTAAPTATRSARAGRPGWRRSRIGWRGASSGRGRPRSARRFASARA